MEVVEAVVVISVAVVEAEVEGVGSINLQNKDHQKKYELIFGFSIILFHKITSIVKIYNSFSM